MKPLIKQGLLLAALVAAFAPAQAQSGSAAEHEPGAPVPLVLSVASERVPLGMPITLMGSGPVLADAPPKVKVILPDGRQAEATVTVVAPGRFELSWRDTQRQGRYSFELSLAGQPQTAQAEVEVVTAVAALADARAALDGAVEAAEKGLRALDQRLAKLPPSPARDAGRAKLKAYSDGTAVHHAHLRQTLERLDGLAKAGKDMPVSLGALGRRLQPSLALTRERRGIMAAIAQPPKMQKFSQVVVVRREFVRDLEISPIRTPATNALCLRWSAGGLASGQIGRDNGGTLTRWVTN